MSIYTPEDIAFITKGMGILLITIAILLPTIFIMGTLNICPICVCGIDYGHPPCPGLFQIPHGDTR